MVSDVAQPTDIAKGTVVTYDPEVVSPHVQNWINWGVPLSPVMVCVDPFPPVGFANEPTRVAII